MSAAESAAGATLSFMLQPQRAARLVEYEARDNAQPGLIPVIDKLIAQTWKSQMQTGYKGELQGMVNGLVLDRLLTLAATTSAPESVRGIALMEIDGLKKWMNSSVNHANGNQKANLLFGLSQIDAFEKEPGKFSPAPLEPMPDGSPIGDDF
jgi:hypothetical protein